MKYKIFIPIKDIIAQLFPFNLQINVNRSNNEHIYKLLLDKQIP